MIDSYHTADFLKTKIEKHIIEKALKITHILKLKINQNPEARLLNQKIINLNPQVLFL